MASIDHTLQEASARHRAGRLVEAEGLYRQVLVQQPEQPEALDGLGLLVLQVGAAPAASGLFQRAIAGNPNKIPFHFHLSMALAAQGQFDEAVAALNRALAIRANNPEAYFYLGNVLQQAGRIDESIAAYQKSIALNPRSAEVHNNLAAAFRRVSRNPEALAACQAALKLKPDFAEAHTNMGNTLQEMSRINEALAAFGRALALNPKSSEAKLSIGMIHLREGEYAKGWPAYEARIDRARKFSGPDLPRPRWDGGALNGRRILLRAEQGLGDTIHFVRYAPLVAARGGRVVLQCQNELCRLLRGQLGIEEVIGKTDALPAFDVHCQLLSLPGAVGTTLKTIPADVPYLRADPALSRGWAERIGAIGGKLNVGLAWSGSPSNRTDYARSVPLEMFVRLSKIPGVSLYSLQKGVPAQQTKNPPGGMSIVDWTEEIGDFADTAALVAGLDLVISVDTSVAHLAGAMGKRVWTLITIVPDWRWLLNRDDSPWYPTMRLFRQTEKSNWDEVMQRVEKELIVEAAK